MAKSVVWVYNLNMSKQLRYRGIKIGAFGLPTTGKKQVKSTKRIKRDYNRVIPSPFNKDAPKNLVVMYDVPHIKRLERDRFRRQLKIFGYIMIQRSVWVGPSPLPKIFIDYVKSVGLNNKLKTFKLAKPYSDSENLEIKTKQSL